MLTEFQTQKMKHFFKVLDFDKNGTIEEEDFVAIGENLCIFWGFYDGSDEYNRYMQHCRDSWKAFNSSVNNHGERANPQHWLEFAERAIVNVPEEAFNEYLSAVVGEIFDSFDKNNDGYISVEEYVDIFVAYRIEVRFSARAFRKLDLNKDDILGREELISAVTEFFRSDDPDDPGNWLFGPVD